MKFHSWQLTLDTVDHPGGEEWHFTADNLHFTLLILKIDSRQPKLEPQNLRAQHGLVPSWIICSLTIYFISNANNIAKNCQFKCKCMLWLTSWSISSDKESLIHPYTNLWKVSWYHRNSSPCLLLYFSKCLPIWRVIVNDNDWNVYQKYAFYHIFLSFVYRFGSIIIRVNYLLKHRYTASIKRDCFVMINDLESQ